MASTKSGKNKRKSQSGDKQKSYKRKCAVGSQDPNAFYCNGSCVQMMTGPRKSDPRFLCCIGCWAYLRRQGVRLKPAKEK